MLQQGATFAVKECRTPDERDAAISEYNAAGGKVSSTFDRDRRVWTVEAHSFGEDTDDRG